MAALDDPQPDDPQPNLLERRRLTIAAEIARNRQGGHRVPTWVLGLFLAALLGGWLVLIILSG